MDPTFNIFEWLFETLDKRIGPPYNIKLSELFLCLPYPDEAEFEYEIASTFNYGIKSGNILCKDYPNLDLYLRKQPTARLRVFFLSPERIARPFIGWIKKLKYPKVAQTKSIHRIQAETIADSIKLSKLLN